MPRKKRKSKKKPEPPKKIGRPRVNLEFHEARELIRNERIESVRQYAKWWLKNTPAKIPKRPDRAYKHEWQGWNDFLDSNNKYPEHKQAHRKFVEAKAFAHSLALGSKIAWLEYCKTGRKPADIPARPDVVYKDDWFTWMDFLGTDIAAVKRNIEASNAIFFIIQNAGRPSNVYQLGITMEGKDTIVRYQTENRFRIIGLYYCDMGFKWEPIAETVGRQCWDYNRKDEYVITNINELIMAIDDDVEVIRPNR